MHVPTVNRIADHFTETINYMQATEIGRMFPRIKRILLGLNEDSRICRIEDALAN